MNPNFSKAPLDLSKWRKVPTMLIAGGGALSLLGLVISPKEFAYSWLLAFMFYLSLGLGALFLVLVHHLFDAGWSVPIRRFCEHISSLLFPWMAIFWIPIYLLRHKLYHWMSVDSAGDHALKAKLPLFTETGFLLISLACFATWWLLSSRLRN